MGGHSKTRVEINSEVADNGHHGTGPPFRGSAIPGIRVSVGLGLGRVRVGLGLG